MSKHRLVTYKLEGEMPDFFWFNETYDGRGYLMILNRKTKMIYPARHPLSFAIPSVAIFQAMEMNRLLGWTEANVSVVLKELDKVTNANTKKK